MTKRPFTVVGYITGDSLAFCHLTWSDNPEEAIQDTMNEIFDPDSDDPDLVTWAVLAGHHEYLQAGE